MITRKVGPALAAGCTVVTKSAAETPLTANALAELAHRAGIPKGVVNFITAKDNLAEVGTTITSSPIVRKISFTGSTRIGKLLMEQSSSTLKKLSLELGGNAPFVIFDDADLDAAVRGALSRKFNTTGQTCISANRIYVQRGIYAAFTAAFATAVRALGVGSGFAPDSAVGPLIHARAVEKVEAHVRDALAHGATCVLGGQRLPDLGPNFFAPTVLADMSSDTMLLAREEVFGPVAGLFPFDGGEAEVVALANAADVGLAAYIYSADLRRVFRVAEALDVGMVGVNTSVISDPAAPFGGVKESGFGREGSKYGVGEYVVTKTITLGGMDGPLHGGM